MTTNAVDSQRERSARPGVALRADFARALPELGEASRAQQFAQPELLMINDSLADELGLDTEWLSGEEGIRFLLGEAGENATHVAQAYAGHQFGAYNPRLGDGRALLLGERLDRHGQLRDVHLKGSGPTSFSRGDGYATVGPMLREYVLGEAMHSLGIPTTRALAVLLTGRHVVRPEAFDPLPGAVLVRTAASHIRVGTFQYARATGQIELLQRLTDFAITRHFPELIGTETPGTHLLEKVVKAQARLVASWMLVGFVHGVMNTDNTTISGETIDYGPCAFIDTYDPTAVFSSIDHAGRYAYGNQPGITHWNLTRFAEALLPLISDEAGGEAEARELALGILSKFSEAFDDAWCAGMRRKLGLGAVPEQQVSDITLAELVGPMLGDLRVHRVDFTTFFRRLADAARRQYDGLEVLFGKDYVAEARANAESWLSVWLNLSPDADVMDAANPLYIPRNRTLDEALESATQGDLAPLLRMLDAVTQPFERRPGLDTFEQAPTAGLSRHVTYCGT